MQLDTAPSDESVAEPEEEIEETTSRETIEHIDTTAEEETHEEVAAEEPVTEVEPEEDIAEFITRDITIQADRLLSGHVVEETGTNNGWCIIGDNPDNKQIKGYLSFDVSELTGINVLVVSLNLTNLIISQNPADVSESLNIKAYDYEDSLDLGDFAVGGTDIVTLNITGIENGGNIFVSENDVLQNTLQSVINEEENWYQLKLGLKGTTDNDNLQDSIACSFDSALLIINYSE